MMQSGMLGVIRQYAGIEIFWIALSVFLVAMGKGGLPTAPMAVPILVLIWPGQVEQAKTAVAFMLPLLIVMDIFGVILYRKHILWKRFLPLLPGAVAGISAASILFVSKANSFIYIPDKWLKLIIGIVGIGFIAYQAMKNWMLKRLQEEGKQYGWASATGFGFGTGVISTLTNNAIPVAHMYYLPQKLEKMNFAATVVFLFFCLNVIKMVPFSLLGRIEAHNLLLGLWMVPVIPGGVIAGYLLVRAMKRKHYIGFIYAVLGITSILLIIKTFLG